MVDISLSGQEGVKCLYLFAVQHLIICICTLLAHLLYISCTCTKMYLRSMVDVSLSGDGKAREDVG